MYFELFLPLLRFFVSFPPPPMSNLTVMTDCNRKTPAMPARESNCDDTALVKQFAQGDNNAFETIIENHRHDVASLANRLLGWPGDVDDICQEVFLAAYLGLKKFRHQSSIKTWLFKITINKCRTHRRRRMLQLKFFTKTVRQDNDPSDVPKLAADDDHQSSRIRKAVRSIPGKYREPVILKYLNQMPSDRICEILGITKNTLHVRLNRARNMLKEQLKDLMEK